MNPITEQWHPGIILRGLETWEILQTIDLPRMTLRRRAEVNAERGFNFERLFCWGGRYTPEWGSDGWYHRIERAIHHNSQRGIYTCISCTAGVGGPKLETDRRKRDRVVAELVDRFGHLLGVIWEAGNELPMEDWRWGVETSGWFVREGLVALWALASDEVRRAKVAGVPVPIPHGVALQGLHVSGVPNVAGIMPPVVYQIDHVNSQDGLKAFGAAVQGGVIDKAEEGEYVGLVGLASYEQQGITYGLEDWDHPPLADWRPSIGAIAEFRTEQPEPEPAPEPGPSTGKKANPPQDAARKYAALESSWANFVGEAGADVSDIRAQWSKTPKAQRLMAEFRKHLMRESPRWEEAEREG